MILEVKNLIKKFGSFTAINGISFSVAFFAFTLKTALQSGRVVKLI
ncbi:hypothetical protein HYU94_03980 [Candidatus Daviesbacteria bacterium]|nr:hypothetical protein [Candidatus Daviesbacteria bacterium]